MARVALPGSLTRLFPGAPSELTLTAATVGAVVEALDARWPGMRDRLCQREGSLRPYVLVFVDGQAASFASPVGPEAEVVVIPAVAGGGPAGQRGRTRTRMSPVPAARGSSAFPRIAPPG